VDDEVFPSAFFRVVKSHPPTREDFLSAAALGRRLRGSNPELRRLFDGISVTDSLQQARQTAADFPRLGRFIATLVIPTGAPVRWEQTLREGHYTIWAEPDLLLRLVTEVVPARPETDSDGLL
jgi:hypothetical protein